MPESDVKAPKGKKPPKWVYPVGAVALVGLILYIRAKRRKTEGQATEPGSEGLSNQSFIPVTGENVAGMGSSYGTAGSGEGVNSTLLEYIKSSQETNLQHEATEHAFFQELIQNLGTGGGAPTSGGPPGTTPAPPQGGGTPPTPPPAPAPPPVAAATCPSSFPDYNSANGAPGPHSCYKYSRDRCSDKARPYKHVYQDGHIVCAST